MNLLSLSAELKKPLLYEKSPYPFWNDEHISKGMLEAHLAANWDAASRRASFMDASVAWIAETIPPTTYPRLLDLGCGPGLYAERFEQAGYAVTGVDVSARSIAYAKQAAQEDDRKAVFYVADYLLLDLHSSFDFATLIYCDYGALSTEDRAELLRRAAHHLRPGGRFLLDVSTVHAFEQFQETQYWALCREGGY